MTVTIATWQPGLHVATLYATVQDDASAYLNGSAFEVYNATHWSAYGIALPESSSIPGNFAGAWPTGLPANGYVVTAYHQIGSSPAAPDSENPDPVIAGPGRTLWPGDGSGVTPNPGTGSDLWTALLAWMQADPTLALAFPGGIVQGRIATAQALPYLRIEELDANQPDSADDETHFPTFTSVAGTDDAVKAAMDQLVRRLLDPTGRTPLSFTATVDGRVWTEAGIQVEPPGSRPLLAGYGPGGSNVWMLAKRFRVWLEASP